MKTVVRKHILRRWLNMIAAQQPLSRIALDANMHAAAEMIDLLPQMKRRMGNCRLIEDIDYGSHGGAILRLDILKPRSHGPHPVLIYLHGGAFAIGSKRTHRAMAVGYASQGYLVCIIDYRLSPEFPFPAGLEDACTAWLWVIDHVGEYGGDHQCIGLAGDTVLRFFTDQHPRAIPSHWSVTVSREHRHGRGTFVSGRIRKPPSSATCVS